MLVLISGATSGFGWDLALRFARQGHHVIATGRRQANLDKLKLEGGDNIYTLALDVTDEAAVNGLVRSLPDGWQDIDVLVNNAGLALGLEPAQHADMGDWNTMIDVNVKGLVHLTRVILPGMVWRNRGHIINLGSTAGSWPYEGGMSMVPQKLLFVSSA